jgi:tripartite ATP-independent transporter DctM subunit
MEPWAISSLGIFIILFFLLFTGVPVGFAMLLSGIIYAVYAWGPSGVTTSIAGSFSSAADFVLIAAPLFILMGEFIARSTVGTYVFKAIDDWLSFLPGRLAISTIGATTIFGAATGFSGMGTAALGPIVIPEMFNRKYDHNLAMGAVVGGSALGVLIPPSVPFIVYGYLSHVSITTLFFAGLVPGLVGSLLFMAYIVIICAINPNLAPPVVLKPTWSQRLIDIWRVFPFFLLVIAVLGSIWFGVATPTEAAAVGAVGALVLIAPRRDFNWDKARAILLNTLKQTVMVYLVIVGSCTLSQTLSACGFVIGFTELVVSLPMGKAAVVGLMMVVNLFLGCFLSTLGVLFLTLPIYLPIVNAFHVNLIWFGVLLVINSEVGCLTPPVGINLYFLKAVSPPDVTFADCVRAAVPYMGLYIVLMLIIYFSPVICLWLPSIM